MPPFMYGSETMIWREKERFRIRGVQMDSLRGLLGIRSMDRFPTDGYGSCADFSYLLALLIFYFRSFHGMMRADPAVAGGG